MNSTTTETSRNQALVKFAGWQITIEFDIIYIIKKTEKWISIKL
jgi:hypothetical protein